jgi:hypothetical protein
MRRVLAIAGILATMCASATAQSPPGQTNETTIACRSDDDFERYATLLLDDVSAAIMFQMQRGCVKLAAHIPVRVDHISQHAGILHACIRPAGSYECFWTFAGHISTDIPRSNDPFGKGGFE